MAQLLKRLLILAVMVSFISSSSAQTAASTSDMQLLSDCDAHTGICSVPKNDGKVTKAAVTDQDDTTEYEPSTGPAGGICMPGTTVCIPPLPAATDEDAPLIICDPITNICSVGANTINSVVPEPAKGLLPKPDNPTNNIVCTPGTPNCGHGHPNPSKDEL